MVYHSFYFPMSKLIDSISDFDDEIVSNPIV
jgi:hypothetical protein